jgi:hypothetical protein
LVNAPDALSILASALETALGFDVAAIHLARVSALARANPGVADALLANELRRWRRVTAAVRRT